MAREHELERVRQTNTLLFSYKISSIDDRVAGKKSLLSLIARSHKHTQGHNHLSEMQCCNLVQLFWAAKMPKNKNNGEVQQKSKFTRARTWEWLTKWMHLSFFFIHFHWASGSVSIQLAFGVRLKCANVWPQLWHLTSCYRCCRLSLDFFSASFRPVQCGWCYVIFCFVWLTSSFCNRIAAHNVVGALMIVVAGHRGTGLV